MKVKFELDVTPEQRAAIGRALGTWKAAPEEGVKVWASGVLAKALAKLEEDRAAHHAHAYVSTACFHGECGACRNTCKYCDAVCSCPHHGSGQVPPEPWVDQARGIARELLRYGLSRHEAVPPELLRRISSDPGLFWLRGEVQPPGEWRGTPKPPAIALLEDALFLRMNGERPPGHEEATWRAWEPKAETFLRSLLPPDPEGEEP